MHLIGLIMRQQLICSIFSIILFSQLAMSLNLKTIKEKNQCTFLAIGKHLNVKDLEKIQLPVVRYSGEMTIKEFQDEIEGFWKMRPDVFLNAYNALTNKIYLATDESRYKLPRTQLDSLAHEYTHFFQFLKSGKDLARIIEDDEFNESQAVSVQTWFRDTNPCGL